MVRGSMLHCFSASWERVFAFRGAKETRAGKGSLTLPQRDWRHFALFPPGTAASNLPGIMLAMIRSRLSHKPDSRMTFAAAYRYPLAPGALR